jgi:hypothetical protein
MTYSQMYNYPSFYAYILSLIIIFVSMILFCSNYDEIKLNPSMITIIVILFAILLTLHTISHMMLEYHSKHRHRYHY